LTTIRTLRKTWYRKVLEREREIVEGEIKRKNIELLKRGKIVEGDGGLPMNYFVVRWIRTCTPGKDAFEWATDSREAAQGKRFGYMSTGVVAVEPSRGRETTRAHEDSRKRRHGKVGGGDYHD
jgi:hypothetical protein